MSENLEINSNISHYRIISKIGAGGMGEVYLAEDTRLNRKVALKLLAETFAEDQDRMSRFVREAKSVSALNHPNILTIHEIGESSSHHYISTEFIAGETLRDVIDRGPIRVGKCLEIAAQVAAALNAAHEASIVHRDIKPENVMIRADGLVKVLDFGLAKLSEIQSSDSESGTRVQAHTQPGIIMGTVAYMSPEQARGKAVDARTDIWSLGVVIYEMLSGRQPFGGETTTDILANILHREPKPLANVPAELIRIVSRTLAKNLDERYQTTKDVVSDLKDLQKRREFEAELERSSSLDIRAEARTQIIATAVTSETRNSIAVLPFTNMSADEENEYFCDGLAEELLNALAKIDDLKVAARTSTFSFKGKDANVSEIGATLGVRTVLEGSVRKSGDRVRITVQLIDAADGYHIWSERYDREMRSIFDVQDEITLAVVDALKLKLFGDEKAAVLRRYTDNPEAYELYVKGLYHYHKYTAEGWLNAIDCFEQAIEIEPNYATAYAKLASAFSFCWFFSILPADETVAKWKTANIRALEIDDSLDEAHSLFGRFKFYYEWNSAEAEREFLRSIELNPDNPEVHHQYGMFLACMERPSDAIAEGQRALALDPLSLLVNLQVGWIYLFAGQVDEFFQLAKKILAMEPNFHGAHWQMGRALAAKGLHEESLEAYRKAWSLGSVQVVLSGIGLTCGILGRRDEAIAVLDQLFEMRKHQPVTAMNIARVYNGLGDTEKAIEWLEIAVEERNGELVFLNIETKGEAEVFGKSIRQDPRFQNILRIVGLQADENVRDTGAALEAPTVMLTHATADGNQDGEKGRKGDGEKIVTSSGDLVSQPKLTNSEIQTLAEKPKAKPKWWPFGLLSLVLIIGGYFGYNYYQSTLRINSIAVLPFQNKSGDPDSEYLSDGLAESLIYRLSQIPNLKVSPTSSVIQYKGKDTKVATIASELGVDAVMTGRLAQIGDNLTISVELVDVRNNKLLWGEQYDRKMTDLLTTQREIATAITQKLQLKLSGEDVKGINKKYTDNNEAYQLFLKGRFFGSKRTAKDAQKAIEYYQQAVATDPKYALAYAGLAEANWFLALYSYPQVNEVVPKARELALKAIELDSSLAEPHSILGSICFNYDLDFACMEREQKRAIDLNPNYSEGHRRYGLLLQYLGRFDEAGIAYKRALGIDPLSPVANQNYAQLLFFEKKYDESETLSKKNVDLDPNYWYAHWQLFNVYRQKGDYAAAVEELAKVQDARGEPDAAKFIRESFAGGDWQGFLRKISGDRTRLKLYPYFVATFFAELAEKDKAFAMLKEAIETKDQHTTGMKVDPFMDPLRDDPRFKEVLRRAGFPE